MSSLLGLRSLLVLSSVALFSLVSLQCSSSETPFTPGTMGGSSGGPGAGAGDGDRDGDGDGNGAGDRDGDGTGGGSAVCETEGEIVCFGECIVANTDEHCGSCGHGCGLGATCQDVDGSYECACPEGLLRCAAACIDPLSHPRYCGASGACTGGTAEAGNDCGIGGACDDGSCRCADTHTKCDAKCVNTDEDPDYCGTSPDQCGVQCKTNAVCNGGSCACPSGTNDCSDGCFDFQTAEEACGGCADSGGEVCDTAKGFECSAGSCACPDGWVECGDGVCRDPDADPNACGGCPADGGTTCSGGTPACHEGTCYSGPCDPSLVPECDGLSPMKEGDCSDALDKFSVGILCNHAPKDSCYELEAKDAWDTFRCWWSNEVSMTVNGGSFACNRDGVNYLDLPEPRAGGYCVAISGSDDGNEGFALGSL